MTFTLTPSSRLSRPARLSASLTNEYSIASSANRVHLLSAQYLWVVGLKRIQTWGLSPTEPLPLLEPATIRKGKAQDSIGQ